MDKETYYNPSGLEAYSMTSPEKFSNGSPVFDNYAGRIVEERGLRVGEAADMYGDITTAEDYGYVTRGYTQGSGKYLRRAAKGAHQAQIPSYSIHRPWRNDRHRSFLGYWTCLYASWSSVAVARL